MCKHKSVRIGLPVYANKYSTNRLPIEDMIFTAIQVSRSQSTSQEFKAFGAENLAPAVVSETRIYAVPVTSLGLKRRTIA
jgi:hypothetical protein